MGASLEWDELPIARKSLLPGEGFFRDDDDDEAGVEPSELAEAAVVVIADPDADGLTAAALVEAVYGEATLVPTEPRALERTLATVAASVQSPRAVFILDLAPDRDDAIASELEQLVEAAETVAWYDHHQWDPEAIDLVETAGIDLAVGESDEVATADVALDELGVEADHWRELVAVVRDHDLWIKADPRSDDIADFAHWSSPERFMAVVGEHGVDLPPDVEADLATRREEKQALIDAALGRAEYREVGEYTVGIAYGRCSQNEVAEGMRQAGADAAVVIKPGGGVSLRGTETFQRCHEVAERLDGGGHPKAAGCKPPVFDDLLDYAQHWTTQGAAARHAVLQAFRAVV